MLTKAWLGLLSKSYTESRVKSEIDRELLAASGMSCVRLGFMAVSSKEWLSVTAQSTVICKKTSYVFFSAEHNNDTENWLFIVKIVENHGIAPHTFITVVPLLFIRKIVIYLISSISTITLVSRCFCESTEEQFDDSSSDSEWQIRKQRYREHTVWMKWVTEPILDPRTQRTALETRFIC